MKLIDLTGRKFGDWTVSHRHTKNKTGHAMWICVCICGTEREICGTDLTRRNPTGCGCRKHGHARRGDRSPEHQAWADMRQRCNNPKNKSWDIYGARGIAVCDRWENFEKFLSDMGERPAGMSLDRINNDGNYEPGNCRWTTNSVQAVNRGTTKLDARKVMEIRCFARDQRISHRMIADMYGVKRTSIRSIIYGQKWKYVA